MPKTLSLLAVLKKVDVKGIKSLSDAQWNTFLASDTEPNEIQAKIAKLEGYEEKGVAYDATGELIVEDNQAMIDRFKERTGRAKGRESLKVKKSKINVKSFKENFLDKDEEPVKPDTTGTSTLTNFQPPTSNPDLSLPDAEEKKEETEGLKGIRDVLDDILKVLRLDFKGDRKEARDAQKEAARKKRGKREDELEGKGGVGKAAAGIGKSVKAMVSPFSNIWDTIINFIKNVFIGALFNKTMKWFSDPKNQDKVKSIGKFFRDWWPALTTAALLFLTPLGGLVSGVVGLLTAIIPKIVMAIASNPWAAALVGTGVAIWGISKMVRKQDEGKNIADAQNQSSKQLQEEGMGAGDAEVLSQSVTTSNVNRMTEGDTNIRSNTNMLQTGMNDPLGGNSMGRFNEGGLVQSSSTQSTQSNQTSNIQNYNQGGSVYQYNNGNGTYHYNEGGAAKHFIQKYNQGGLVEHFNEGGMVGKELVYSTRKFTTEKVVKGDEIERTKTRERTTGAIQLEDLYENQDQILSQLPEGTTIESIVNGTSGIDPQVLYPILQSSDAQMASTAKERATDMQMMQDNNLINPDNTVKGFSSYDQNFKGGGSVKGFNKGGGSVKGFNKGGEVPGSGNKDTVPAMLTPGEFVMSKGAVDKYGSDTLESMNAAASSGTKGDKGDKGDKVPAMLTPGEFVVSAPAVQKFGVDTMESMNLKGGGNNKPELKEPNVEVNNGGLINNYRKMQSNHYATGGVVKSNHYSTSTGGMVKSNHYSTGGVVKYFQSGGLVQYLQGGGEVDKPQGMMRWLAGAADHMTMGLTDFDKRGSMVDGMQRIAEKVAPGTPVKQGENKTITLPTIPKQDQSMTRSNSDVPQFRIPIQSSQRSMVISSLGISDLIGG